MCMEVCHSRELEREHTGVSYDDRGFFSAVGLFCLDSRSLLMKERGSSL